MDTLLARLAQSSELLQGLARGWSRLWRPLGQPSWARPALLAVAAVAALSYGWGLGEAALEPVYAGAARSMSGSWHDFVFGALDPLGTITVDKLPGALWLQALSLRIFGFHVWALALPQAIEGVIAVLVLYRAMRRLAGPVAGIAAAGVLALNPATVVLNRGNVSDSLLVMLSVLAVDATVSALISGRLRPLLLAGVWVGLAFQAKMMQAWLILPALALAYVVAAPPSLRVRLGQVALAGLVTVAVSLSWMVAVSLVPAGERPYVDGTQNDSVFSQVFVYNGISRLGRSWTLSGAGHRASFFASGGGTAPNALAEHVSPSWHRLLGGIYGRDIGWLLPAALISVIAVLLARRGRGRRDLMRTSVLLWGAWLLPLWVTFSDGLYLHSYYVAALAPALAGLCGTGVALAWSRRERPFVRRILAATLVVSLGYGVYLLNGGAGVPSWLIPLATVATAIGVVALLAPQAKLRRMAARAAATAICCALVLPAVVSALIVTRGLGSFAAPFEPASATSTPAQAGRRRARDARFVEALEARYQAPIVFAIDTGRLAGPYIFASGKEILPLGGFEGGIPSPTPRQLRGYVASGMLRAVLVPPERENAGIAWIQSHCRRTQTETRGRIDLVLYECGAA